METVETIKVPRPVSGISLSWSKISLSATCAFMILLILVHLVKTDLDPSWRMISEYAIGQHGWLMTVAFLMWALSYTALFFGVRSQIKNTGGKIGLALLLINMLGLLVAAIFVTDPVTARPEEGTTSGMLHNLGGTLGMAMPFAVMLISWSLFKNPNWVTVRKTVLWSGILAVFGFSGSIVSLGNMLSATNGGNWARYARGLPYAF